MGDAMGSTEVYVLGAASLRCVCGMRWADYLLGHRIRKLLAHDSASVPGHMCLRACCNREPRVRRPMLRK
jgi:hypothetical protein